MADHFVVEEGSRGSGSGECIYLQQPGGILSTVKVLYKLQLMIIIMN